jgi:hypothetical protein
MAARRTGQHRLVVGAEMEPLSTYLNDHLAGSTVGVNLARRLAGEQHTMHELAAEIVQDRQTLLALMERLGVRVDRVKVALAKAAEQASRVKLGADRPLNRLETLETLSLGVEGKLAMWEALKRSRAGVPDVAAFDLDALIARARTQRERLEGERMRAAAASFGG